MKEGEENLFEDMRQYVEAKERRTKIRDDYWDAIFVFFDTRDLLKHDKNYTVGNLTSEIEQKWAPKNEMFKSERDYAHEINFYLNIAQEAVEVRVLVWNFWNFQEYENYAKEDPPTGSQPLLALQESLYNQTETLKDMINEAAGYRSANKEFSKDIKK